VNKNEKYKAQEKVRSKEFAHPIRAKNLVEAEETLGKPLFKKVEEQLNQYKF